MSNQGETAEFAELDDLRAALKTALTQAIAPLVARLDQVEAANRDRAIGLLAQLDQLEAAAAERARLTKGSTRNVHCN